MAALLFEGGLLADYFQLYLRDEAHDELPDAYTDEALADRLIAGPHAVILFTVRNFTVPVRVEWHERYPEPGVFQHVAEAGLACPTGRLVLAGLMDYEPDAVRLAVPAGIIGVQTSFAGLDTLDEFEIEGNDRYLLRLWPAAEAGAVRVLARWPAG